jgi:TolB-like protein
MKKFLLTALFVLIGSLVFAQERPAIAVFPFEDMDKVFTGNEAVFFYRQFSNEFTNKYTSKYTIVPRQEVEKLINTEAAFQLSDFSAKAKTAEMQRVLNGTQILSGVIGKVGSRITISVSLYTYPELSQLPGGVDLRVANVDELFDKIPELVQSMQDGIAKATPPPPLVNPFIGRWRSSFSGRKALTCILSFNDKGEIIIEQYDTEMRWTNYKGNEVEYEAKTGKGTGTYSFNERENGVIEIHISIVISGVYSRFSVIDTIGSINKKAPNQFKVSGMLASGAGSWKSYENFYKIP